MKTNELKDKIEDILIGQGLITKDQLGVAKETLKNLGGSLEQILIEKGYVAEDKLLKGLAKGMNTTFVSLSKFKIDEIVARLLPASLAKKYRAVPLFRIEDKVTIATSNPLNLEGMDDVRAALGHDIEVMYALDGDIDEAIREHYRGLDITDEPEGHVEIVGNEEDVPAEAQAERLLKEASGEKTVLAVNNILYQAFRERASDIHFEPHRAGLKVRIRVDGLLEHFADLPKSMHQAVISRVKIMGGMDVAERRNSQDGRVRIRIDHEETDLRIATYPTMFGEAAAVRILSKKELITLTELGFSAHDLEVFKDLITRPHGIFLVTGPTGSGKTTTLYASLMHVNSEDKHILSIEDPVEHEIPNVDQQQVNARAGVTFATALRSMLRQDPDVIMVGEIRDFETADIAIRAAMTGHLVFSTLHTNTSVGAINRLIDLGVQPFLISSTITGVMAQRLVRRICSKCRKPVAITSEQLKKFGKKIAITSAFRGEGCKVCRSTGYHGRVGLFEIVSINDEIKNMINEKKSEIEIKEHLVGQGLKSLIDDGLEKIKDGTTTVEEVLKVIEEI